MYLMLPVSPVRFTCILQGTFCDTGILHNFYVEKIYSAHIKELETYFALLYFWIFAQCV